MAEDPNYNDYAASRQVRQPRAVKRGSSKGAHENDGSVLNTQNINNQSALSFSPQQGIKMRNNMKTNS